jgi:4-amino-4-deoxy-L-arabinose transferase-like glycosyltransferase
MKRSSRQLLRSLSVIVILLVSLPVSYPLLVWVYCLTDDNILRPDAGRWEYHKGTFWHTYHDGATDAGVYDRQIDLCCPPYFNLGYDKR